MKNNFLRMLSVFLLLLVSSGVFAQSFLINFPAFSTAPTANHTALESNTKGFVITRVPTSGLSAITNPVEGMMVYDTTAKCLKIYVVDNTVPANTGWKCFSTPACP